jgi:hypothetical protein
MSIPSQSQLKGTHNAIAERESAVAKKGGLQNSNLCKLHKKRINQSINQSMYFALLVA